MEFDRVYNLIREYESPEGEKVLFLLEERTSRAIYDHIVSTGATRCLELGTGYGSTTCVMAAALDEIGEGRVTTVDTLERTPIGIRDLAKHTGLADFIDPVNARYDWYLRGLVERQTSANRCEPCLDFCFLDGAHEWNPDALAAFLATKLLRAGAWLALDDLNFKLRGCQPGWETTFADRSEEELDHYQVREVFDLVLRQHQDLGEFTVADGGRTGWARKAGGTKTPWRPIGRSLDPETLAWRATYSADELIKAAYVSDGISTEREGSTVEIEAKEIDPNFVLKHDLGNGRNIDVVRLRMRLVSPAEEVLQIYWRETELQPFVEDRSVRIKLKASDDWQELVVRVNGSENARPIHGIRVDITDGASSLCWSSLTVGGR